jgi:hypothetical protein
MKLKDLVGTVVARTQPRVSKSRDTFTIYGNDSREDRSFLSNPIKIVDHLDGLTYYLDRELGAVRILPADYDDGHWAPIAPKFYEDLWPTPNEAVE